MKNGVYLRKLFGKTHLVVNSLKINNTTKNQLFMMDKRNENLDTIIDEINNIRKRRKKEEITLIGKLKQEEIIELANMGIKFEFSTETKGFMLKLDK